MRTRITKERIDKIVENTEFNITTVFNKCTVVTAKLPNGFVITESSACIDEKNYSKNLGYEICREKIIGKIWELEGYRLQQKIYKKKLKKIDKKIKKKEKELELNQDIQDRLTDEIIYRNNYV